MALKTLENAPVMGMYYQKYVPSSADPCGVVPTYNSGPYQISIGSNYRRGQAVPDYSKRIRTKLSASSQYERTRVSIEKVDIGHFEQIYGATSCAATKWSPTEFRYTMYGTSSTLWSTALRLSSVPQDTTIRDIAVRKLRAKINDHEATYNAIVPIVELREFHGLVRGIQQSATGLVRAQHRVLDLVHSRKSLLRALGSAGNAWLSWSFGLKPMLNDAEAAAKAVAYATVEQETYRVRSSHSKEWTAYYSPSFWLGQALGKVKVDYFSQARYLLRYSYAMGLNPLVESANNYAALADHLGLSWRSVGPAAWELLPYSWLLDYFGTIGDAIEDTFQVTRTPIYGTLATTLVTEITNSVKPTTRNGYVGYVYSNPCICSQVPVVKMRFVNYERALIQTVPERAFRFKTVDEIASNSGNKLANLLSLLAARNASCVKRYGLRL